MSGHDSVPDAPQHFAREIQASGCMPSNKFAPTQIGQLQALAGARGDDAFGRYVARVCPGQKAASGN
jgi:hypothetical protein